MKKPGKAYRVIWDEPIGICVGFKPSKMPPELDAEEEFTVVADDGGDYAYCYYPEDSKVKDPITISKKEKLGDRYPEPDLEIWRTEAEFKEFAEELLGE